jgi:F-type H+-transporting ATPase subunit epsilon
VTGKVFQLEIVTPRGAIFNGGVESFSAPGAKGRFQVLRSHAPMLSSLRIGEIRVLDAEGTERRYAISGGFVEVRNNAVIVLADAAENAGEIDVERATNARDRSKKRIAEKNPQTDLDRARLSLQRALNRLKIAGAR